MKPKGSIALALTLASACAHADAELHPIRVFHGEGSRTVVKVLSSRELGQGWAKLRSTPPHRLVNPEHKAFLFEGPPIRQLLRNTGLERAHYAYVLGSDGYVAMLPASILRNSGAILALRRGGKPISPEQGEQELIFPSEPPNAVPEPYRSKSAFWPWYARAFVVGDLPNTLYVAAEPKPMERASRGQPAVQYVPPSLVRIDARKCPAAAEVSLSAIRGLEHSSHVRANLLYKDPMPLPLEASRYHLLKSTSSTAIPIECGGPFILVKPEASAQGGNYGPDDLIYFVLGMEQAP